MLFNIIMILLIIIGVGLIIFACFTKKGKKNTPSDYFEANASVQLVK